MKYLFLLGFAICYWRSNWLFTFFPLPQTSQPVTFPEGSLAQDGNDPCRPRWLVSCQEDAGWKTLKDDSFFSSNHLELSARCPQVGCVFIGAPIDVWPVDPVSDLVQLLPEDILHLRAEHFCLTFFTSSEGHTSSLAKKGFEQSSYKSSFPEMITFTLFGFELDKGCRI